jgi:hypothetical protein
MLGDGQRRMLLHIEIQAQRDTALAQRVHDYNYRLGKAHGLPVTSLVLLADAAPTGVQIFHQPVRGSARTFSFTTAKLLDYVSDLDARLRAVRLPGSRWPVLTQQAHHHPDALYAAKLRVTKLLFQHRWKPRRIMVLFDVINWMMVLPESHQRRYWQAVLRLKKEHEMKLLNPLEQMFFDDGVKSGLKQGLEQGLEQVWSRGWSWAHGRSAALLERLLTQRFGPLPQTVRKKLAKASVAQVEAWSDALVEAQTLKQVFDHRGGNASLGSSGLGGRFRCALAQGGDGGAGHAPVVGLDFIDDDEGGGRIFVQHFLQQVGHALNQLLLLLGSRAFIGDADIYEWHSFAPWLKIVR